MGRATEATPQEERPSPEFAQMACCTEILLMASTQARCVRVWLFADIIGKIKKIVGADELRYEIYIDKNQNLNLPHEKELALLR